jgi:hypothetical protein
MLQHRKKIGYDYGTNAQISKNVVLTLKFWVPDELYEASSILRSHKYQMPGYKIE